MITPNKAKDLAILAHTGQYRRDGVTPYVTHPIEVADMLETDEEKIIGYLHDIVEDCEGYELSILPTRKDKYIIWYEHTTSYPLSDYIGKCLVLLTKDKYQPYQDYIKKITQRNWGIHKTCKKVKIADIVCNLSGNPSDHAKKKYSKAMKVLLKNI